MESVTAPGTTTADLNGWSRVTAGSLGPVSASRGVNRDGAVTVTFGRSWGSSYLATYNSHTWAWKIW
ncbi:hypothetical protein O3S80_11465 [Streptomyces sp. Lzd4kr]|nr:hypothetical protein [Streptomyces sp. Lzd4kr]